MGIRDLLGPVSLNQILYVFLFWVVLIILSTSIYDSPLLRLEIIIGTGILLVWVVWGVYYRLEQIPKERYKRK